MGGVRCPLFLPPSHTDQRRLASAAVQRCANCAIVRSQIQIRLL